MLVLKSSVLQILRDSNASPELQAKVSSLHECKPISSEEALEIIQSFILKKELNIDCISYIQGILVRDQLLLIDDILFKKPNNYYITAIKKRKEFFADGLADAKAYVDTRMKQLGITRD
jgi:hypothetical protein